MLDSAPKPKDVESQHIKMTELQNTVEKRMLFGEIGRIALGKLGLLLVNIALIATQYGFCIAYFIFLGNTLGSMFPMIWQQEPESEARKLRLNISNSTLPSDRNSTATIMHRLVSSAPSFPLLILIPLFPLVFMSYVRSVRKLGPISFAANVTLLAAFLSVVGYMMSGRYYDA